MAGDYVELKGRTCEKTATNYVYHCRGVSATLTSTGIPKEGAVLATPSFSHTLSATCRSVAADEISEPTRVMWTSAWATPIERTEAYV